MAAHITGSNTIAKGRFIRLDIMEYVTSSGKQCTWEAAQRNTSNVAALMIAILKPSNRVLLVRQFRPPLQTYSLEFPAGLVDPGESIAETAIRELREETGYVGRILWETGACASSPGITGEMVSMVFIEVDENLPENQQHAQDLQDNEEIEVLAVPMDKIADTIAASRERGDTICSRLALWAASNSGKW